MIVDVDVDITAPDILSWLTSEQLKFLASRPGRSLGYSLAKIFSTVHQDSR